MPFITPLKLQLLNEASEFPWILLDDFSWQDPETDEVFTAPKHFRTDGASVPPQVALVPIIGQAMFLRMFATGMFKAFKPGVIHDWARRTKDGTRPMPAAQAHLLLKKMMTEYGYEADIVEAYYQAVVTFNSHD